MFLMHGYKTWKFENKIMVKYEEILIEWIKKIQKRPDSLHIVIAQFGDNIPVGDVDKWKKSIAITSRTYFK